MDLRKLFRRRNIAESFRQCLTRFPGSIVFTGLLSMFLLHLTWSDARELNDNQRFVIIYYLSVGTVLSYVLQLWCEEVRRSRTATLIKTAMHALLAADAVYLFCSPEPFAGMEQQLVHVSVVTGLVLSTSVLPFFREGDDLAAWNFTTGLTAHIFVSLGIGLLMLGGLSLLLASFDALFGINVRSEVYISVLILCSLTLPVLLVLGQTPDGERKHDCTAYTSNFQNKIIRFLILPLLGCYLAVLYCYGMTILVKMELPDGWISKLVIALMAGCLCVVGGFYPTLRQEGGKFEQRVTRWLPITILPLLVLMSVAIERRFSDYGITVSRLYLLALNVWFYLVCLGLIAGRARRIRWIAASFAGIFILVSAFPVNFTTVARNAIRNEAQAFLNEHYKDKKLPMSTMEYKQWLSTLPVEEAERIGSLLNYLAHRLDDNIVYQWVDTKGEWFYYASSRSSESHTVFSNTAGQDAVISVPEGYSKMREFWVSPTNPKVKNDTLSFEMEVTDRIRRTVRISVKQLKAISDQKKAEPTTVHSDASCHITITGFRLDLGNENRTADPNTSTSFNCSGYIFMK